MPPDGTCEKREEECPGPKETVTVRKKRKNEKIVKKSVIMALKH